MKLFSMELLVGVPSMLLSNPYTFVAASFVSAMLRSLAFWTCFVRAVFKPCFAPMARILPFYMDIFPSSFPA